ncbi:MAG: hypothetical protein ACRDKW_10610, partial [Actinomycetota bacterium]
MTPVPVTGVCEAGLDLASRVVPIHPAIARQYTWRYEDPGHVGLKVNLYRAWEVAGLGMALAQEDLRNCPIECVMVGDSYLMTHLGRSSTRVEPAERQWALETLAALVAEVRGALAAELTNGRRPFLIADFPDGWALDPTSAVRAAERFL